MVGWMKGGAGAGKGTGDTSTTRKLSIIPNTHNANTKVFLHKSPAAKGKNKKGKRKKERK